MNPYLLDVNALISLVDPMHVHHRRAMTWFTSAGQLHWMTCPLTQNGVIRIISSTKYPQADIAPATIIEVLNDLIAVGNHEFLPDNISLLDSAMVQAGGLRRSSQVTDTYLLALATSAGATLATFDQRITTDAVPDGRVFLLP